jgi:hypothetical protein
VKKIIALLLSPALVIASIALAGCGNGASHTAATSQSVAANTVTSTAAAVSSVPADVIYDIEDITSTWTSADVSYINLNGDSAILDGTGAAISAGMIKIVSAGTYVISGTLDDGQIIVEVGGKETVRLILNGMDITCSTSAPVYIMNAEKVIITLEEGTENYITDGTSYILEDLTSDEPSAAIFSNDDLTINGGGSLTVNANYNNGIQSKDDLHITGGNITVTAVNDGIKGRDSIAVKDGNISIDAGGDGMQSNNDEDAAKGFIAIEVGTIDITAGADGIQAETSILISGGEITISSGGGSGNAATSSGGNFRGSSDTDAASGSARGLKAGVDLSITGGTIKIDSSDDALHSNASMTISGGDISIASGDDGIHADSSIVIDGGDISITKCYEGIESAVITINDGDINLTASDDGINASDGSGSGTVGAPGNGNDALYIRISGGEITINAGADGIDSNGNMFLDGGYTYVVGSSDPESAIDTDGTITVSGGNVVGIGSIGHMESPTESSTQPTLMIIFDSEQTTGTIIKLADDKGNVLFEGTSDKKAFQSFFFTDPSLIKGKSYTLYVDGKEKATITLTTAITICSETGGTVSSNAGGMGGGRGGRR